MKATESVIEIVGAFKRRQSINQASVPDKADISPLQSKVGVLPSHRGSTEGKWPSKQNLSHLPDSVLGGVSGHSKRSSGFLSRLGYAFLHCICISISILSSVWWIERVDEMNWTLDFAFTQHPKSSEKTVKFEIIWCVFAQCFVLSRLLNFSCVCFSSLY